MALIDLILRRVKEAPLLNNEVDDNFENLGLGVDLASTDWYGPEPLVTIPGMKWGDPATSIRYRRSPDNTTWVPESGLFETPINQNALSLNGGQLAGMRNRIINGALQLNQAGLGAQVPVASGVFLADMFRYEESPGLNWFNATLDYSGGFFPGFTNCLSFTSRAAASASGGDYAMIATSIEGFNSKDLQWGTPDAKPITLSFNVMSSLTGTFSGSLRNGDSTRSYVFTYSIAQADTPTKVSITIPGEQTGAWNANHELGISVDWCLGVGTTYSPASPNQWVSGNYVGTNSAVSVAAVSGASFLITGVQLEQGTVATPFEHLPVTVTQLLCQRYYWSGSPGTDMNFNSFQNGVYMSWPIMFPTTMRTAPTCNVNTAGVVGADVNVGSISFGASSDSGARLILQASNTGVNVTISNIPNNFLQASSRI